MKTFRRIAVACAAISMAAAALVSCGDNMKTVTETPSRALSMQISGSGSVEGGVTTTFDTPRQLTLTILARLPWQLSVDAPWVISSRTSGVVTSSSVDVVLTLDKNETKMSRTATVTIVTSEAQPYTFTITQSAENVLSGVNQWMSEEMGKYYYWNTAVQTTAPPSNLLACDEFLETLIESMWGPAVQDTSNGENPPTIDGHWNRKSDSQAANTVRDHIYSYVERVSASSRAGEVSAPTFGMGVIPFYDGNNRSRYLFLVTWVREGSPAATAGLERGTWITKFNGRAITDYVTPYVQINNGSGTIDMSFVPYGGTETSRTVTAARMPVQPILLTKTLTSGGGRKVAYMAYNGFEIDVDMEPYDDRNDRFLTEMRSAFADFKAGGATEMVLDLRYNPGGYVAACQTLSSLISGAGSERVFAQLFRNGDYTEGPNPQVMTFTGESNALGLRKLYVLATGDTASASEMVINALRGIDVEVVVVGGQTNGKNVGMDRFVRTDATGTYHLWPITFKILNADGFCNYAGGFAPDWTINETEGAAKRGERLLPLGDPEEVLLKAALTLIDGGKPAVQNTRAAETSIEPLPTPPDTRGGAKYISETH